MQASACLSLMLLRSLLAHVSIHTLQVSTLLAGQMPFLSLMCMCLSCAGAMPLCKSCSKIGSKEIFTVTIKAPLDESNRSDAKHLSLPLRLTLVLVFQMLRHLFSWDPEHPLHCVGTR